MNRAYIKENLRRGFIFYLLSTLTLAAIFFTYLLRSATLGFMDVTGWVFFTLSCLSHASLFAAIPFLLCFIPATMLKAKYKLSGTLTAFFEAIIAIIFIINGFVFSLYHFHINGLVINLLTGPGANEIFVFSGWLYLKACLYTMGVIAFYFFLMWSADKISKKNLPNLWANGLLTLLTITLLAQGIHIVAAATMKRSVLESADYLPYYFPLRMNSTFEKLGWLDTCELALVEFDNADSAILYPQHELLVEQPDTLLNVVIFGVDSWNWRTMTEECVPNIYHFADSAERFDHHFSSSNGTRGGLFGLFTGISSYYWDSFEYANLHPLFINEMLRQGYQIQAYPSATLANPPFAKVFFGDIEGLHVDTKGKTVFDRDCQITRDFISDLDKRDSQKPFFSFVFYDLPHAIQISEDHQYHFQPSWAYADYMELNNDTDPEPYYNLYRNCVWTVDSLIGEGLKALKNHDMLKNTVIIITGDHGQEFNENRKNYWGHWANYSRPQIGVPMIYYHPHHQPARHDYRTTHYDISTTILKQVLGVKNPVEDLSMGRELQDSTPRLWHVVGNDLFYAFIIEDDIIVEKRGAGNIVIFDKQMNQLNDYPLNAKQLNDAIINLNRFFKK